MTNLLLNMEQLPSFSALKLGEVKSTVEKIIEQNTQTLQRLLAQKEYSWDNLIAPIEEMDNQLMQMWSPISHLHSVMESEELRTLYNDCLPILTEYHTQMMQSSDFYKAIHSMADHVNFSQLNTAQQKVITNSLRDFHLAGVDLSEAKKARFGELQKELSKLSTQFSENILDATHAYTLIITDPADLSGLPDSFIRLSKENAETRDVSGWLITLDSPSYTTAIKFLQNRALRRKLYEAYVTRASDQGPHPHKWDNTQIMEDLLRKRHELAILLGFNNYAEYSLFTKMADSPERVLGFLRELVIKAKPAAEKEIAELKAYALKKDNITSLEPWDIAYYSEKIREEMYSISQEEIRQYFPLNKVFLGVFHLFNKLYGLVIKEVEADKWHPHVQFFEVYDKSGSLRGYLYTDLYARAHKRDGAWMDDCRGRHRSAAGKLQLPVAFLTCNFSRPQDNKPALLTHDDVITLFHEFGHCLHHILTLVDYSPVSGINGVPWDAVEFPSQFHEFWCYEKEALQFMSAHVDTGEPLPEELYQKLQAAKNFHAGLIMLRQLEFALFDFRLHLEYDPKKAFQVQEKLDEVRRLQSVFDTASFNRFQHSFSHIFAGGYAAGYYSYKWAEVLASDAFSLFEEEGIFNEAAGQSFLHNILEQGGVYEPLVLFRQFRGREPSIEALLRHSGV